MTDRKALHTAAAQARAAAAEAEPLGLPCGIARRDDVRAPTQLRVERVKKDGQDFDLIEGYASVTERAYEMWDWLGPYMEIVSADAFDTTLKAAPEVVYRFNHAGTPMARTTNGRLELWADDQGLGDRAWLNPKRSDVEQMVTAIRDGDVTEQSFMFTIVAGQWSPDYTEYRITEVDLDRGDVGPVTYGANPYTSVAARSGDILAALPHLPKIAAGEALEVLAARGDLTVPTLTAPPADRTGGELVKTGRSVAMWQHMLLADDL
jgi:HK97 family phage prohead protease